MSDQLDELTHGDHCCLFFSSPVEQAHLTTAFLEKGLRRGERCLFVGDTASVDRMREGLKQQGLSVAAEEAKGRLVLSSERDYLDQGRWSTEKMLGFLQHAYDSALAGGYTALRAVGDVSWQVGPEQDYRDIVYYETLLDMFFIGKKIVGLCEYPRGKCPPDTLEGIFSTHRVAAVDSHVGANPHYVPAELLLEKNSAIRREKRVDWMTNQLVRLRQAEADRERAINEVVDANYQLAQMEKVRDAFGLFVTPEVADYLLSTPRRTWSRGVKRDVTVLFADVRSFTPFASRHAADAVVEALNSVFSRIAGPIHRHGGILNKFMGDGIMAVFGAPLDVPDHACAAVAAALEIQAEVGALSQERKGKGLDALEVGIGITSGEAAAGCVGTESRTEYTVIGPTVNLAARLENLAEPGGILLGPNTAARVKDRFALEALGPTTVRGMGEPVAVFAVKPS